MSAAVTIRHLDTPEKQHEAMLEMLAAMGFRQEVVAGEEFLIPIDPDHPDYAKALRRIERAQ